jgi:hypothetical protein
VEPLFKTNKEKSIFQRQGMTISTVDQADSHETGIWKKVTFHSDFNLFSKTLLAEATTSPLVLRSGHNETNLFYNPSKSQTFGFVLLICAVFVFLLFYKWREFESLCGVICFFPCFMFLFRNQASIYGDVKVKMSH